MRTEAEVEMFVPEFLFELDRERRFTESRHHAPQFGS
jgi:hypothetical protein